MLLPFNVPFVLSRVVIENIPSPASMNMTCANHVLDTHSGLPYTLAHVSVWFVMEHEGEETSGYCKYKDRIQ